MLSYGVESLSRVFSMIIIRSSWSRMVCFMHWKSNGCTSCIGRSKIIECYCSSSYVRMRSAPELGLMLVEWRKMETPKVRIRSHWLQIRNNSIGPEWTIRRFIYCRALYKNLYRRNVKKKLNSCSYPMPPFSSHWTNIVRKQIEREELIYPRSHGWQVTESKLKF